MESIIFALIFGGGGGALAGLLGGGFWEAFCLVAQRAEPTSDQIAGMALGGGCLGAVTLCICFIAIDVLS